MSSVRGLIGELVVNYTLLRACARPPAPACIVNELAATVSLRLCDQKLLPEPRTLLTFSPSRALLAAMARRGGTTRPKAMARLQRSETPTPATLKRPSACERVGRHPSKAAGLSRHARGTLWQYNVA
eukprot:scaffold13303_cov70-Phaeocystis_antarctica.AAC.5